MESQFVPAGPVNIQAIVHNRDAFVKKISQYC